MRAFIDANVFVHAWTLDVLLSAADAGMFEPHWSMDVIREVERAFSRVRSDGVSAARAMMEAAGRAYPGALVVGYEHRIVDVVLPDEGDRHVLAAAAEAGCDVVITYNLRDFPRDALASLGIEPSHPDDLLMRMVEADPGAMRSVMQELVRRKSHPPRTMEEEVAGLRQNRLARFGDWLEPLAG